MQKGHGFIRVPFLHESADSTAGNYLVGAFLSAAFFGAVFAGVGAGFTAAGATVFGADFRVRIPHTDSNAFLPAVPGFGRSQTMWAWSRASTSPSSRTSTLFGAYTVLR